MPRTSLSDAIKKQLKDRSLYRVAKDTGLAYTTIWRFSTGQTELTLDTAERLMSYLGISWQANKKKD